MKTITVLDDYQRNALTCADWTPVLDTHRVQTIPTHIGDVDELAERLRGSEVIVAIRERTALRADLLARLPDLKLLITFGMSNVALDIDYAIEHGVTVCGTTGAGNAVAEITLGMIIAVTRNFVQEDAAVRRGEWQHTIGPGLMGRTLGLLGLGHLGVRTLELARPLGMDVIAWSPHLTPELAEPHGVRAVSRQEFFRQSDVISIHMRLSDSTRGLIGADDLALMKPSAYLVNTSRGPIVDEAALIQALRESRIAGAALDVYDVEPLPVDHPLRSLPNTLLLPHIGYVTTDGYERAFTQVVENIARWRDGSPVRVIPAGRTAPR